LRDCVDFVDFVLVLLVKPFLVLSFPRYLTLTILKLGLEYNSMFCSSVLFVESLLPGMGYRGSGLLLSVYCECSP
jgi:hypothetical protein